MNNETIRRIVENSYGIVIVFDETGEVLVINEQGREELGVTNEKLMASDIFVQWFLEQTEESVYDTLKEHIEKDVHTSIYRVNGTCFPAIVRCTRLVGRHGDVRYYVVGQDISKNEEVVTRLAKTETKLKESMKARNEFVANVTHELRTPVNGIKGHITNLLAAEDNPEHIKIQEIILQCCKNMEKIINNMLDFSKIEAGKFEITEEVFKIRDCVNHVIDTSMTIANGKGIKLSAYISDDIPEKLVGDELRIVQILNNLVSNAVKFTSIGFVRVEVYCTKQSGNEIELTFFVIDTGIGVTLEEKEKMFKSFSQVDGSITRQYGGTGLGLYVTRQLVELMHGHIELESEKGKGSTFQVTLNLKLGDEVTTMEQVAQKVVAVEELKSRMRQDQENEEVSDIYVFHSKENQKELRRTLEKLVLCIEMGNWEKAEQFSENVKKLCEGAEQPLKSKIFRMQMSVRKEDHDKSIDALELVKQELECEK